jgi:hypothetical protein
LDEETKLLLTFLRIKERTVHASHAPILPPDDYSEELDEDVELDVFDDESGEPSTSAPASGTGGAAPHIRPGIVHRLDKGTSGLLVVAKDERSLKGLSKQFKVRFSLRYASQTSVEG